MTRKRVDIRTLPGCLRWVIVLAVIAGVSFAAWLTGRESPPDPLTDWIMDNLYLLGAVMLLLIALRLYLAWKDRHN